MVNYLTFTSVGTTSTVYLSNSSNTPNCQYSADGGSTWNTMPTSSGSKVSISAGNSILIRGTNSSGFSNNESKYSKFVMTGSIQASGSVMSLIDGVGETTSIPSNALYCFYGLFMGCSSLLSCPELPATILSAFCYYNMFASCVSITNGPVLPANDGGGYMGMFKGCTSLRIPPDISSITTITGYLSLKEMFYGCSSLKISDNPATGYTILFVCPTFPSSSSVKNMFYGTGGTYTSNPVANGTYYFEGSYPTTSSIIHANVNGTWKDTTPYVNVSGTWKEATPYVNVNGTWKESN